MRPCFWRSIFGGRSNSVSAYFASVFFLWRAGLMYCLEYLEQNLDWLQEKLQPYADDGLCVCIVREQLIALRRRLAERTRAATPWHLQDTTFFSIHRAKPNCTPTTRA